MSVMHTDAATTGGSEFAITVKELSKTFRRKGGEVVRAVDQVSLDIKRGEMIVLLGPSGCGKTSLLRCIGGLEQPDSGAITLSGRAVVGARIKPVPPESRNIGMMFQSYALWPHMTVAKNVGYPLEARRIRRDEIAVRVTRMLEMAGIPNLAGQHPGNLSGGQQQRVALVRSLVAEPEIILFDEPLSNVDAKVRTQLRAEIRAMQERLGFAGIYVTHDQEEAMQLADRVAVMRAGQVVEIGSPSELYNKPRSRYVAQFLGDLNYVSVESPESGGANRSAAHEALGRIHFPAADADAAMSESAPLSLGFRPERLKFVADTEATHPVNCWEGSVEQMTFSGACREYSVRVGDDTVLKTKVLEGSSGPLPQVGAVVRVRVDPNDVRVLVNDVSTDRSVTS